MRSPPRSTGCAPRPGRTVRLARTASAFLAAVLSIHTVSAQSADAQETSDAVARARELFDEGVRAYETGNLRRALRCFKAAQASWRRPEFAFNIARVQERMGEADHAISWFRVYLEHGNPTSDERIEVAHRIDALIAFKNRVSHQAAAPPTNEDLTDEARQFFENGVAMYEQRQYRAAMQAFQYAERFHQFPELYFNMALTAERLEDWMNAALYYERYLEGRPNAPGRAQLEERIRDLEHRR